MMIVESAIAWFCSCVFAAFHGISQPKDSFGTEAIKLEYQDMTCGRGCEHFLVVYQSC
jgi:hypothetical protein